MLRDAMADHRIQNRALFEQTLFTSREQDLANTGQARKEKDMNEMTDKQLEVILNLVADKFQSCKDMDDVQKAVQEVRDMAKKEKAE